ncbi:hypothetical protein AMAG_07335 [Allomyces macrogynus ATCC 38327]|uniref:Uncharacterized protein n=1 Tax=Allomyces macrogynus (strain ATCC 38327) TaxID=578462 RepID=A0A0L0SHU9_ALLM3|nr:hypothetical protein AMAG_07335 [Allomyces macrogynus ATCC 38327]|eukprot:KNE62081.1 hypothetical protein AMAG_07335 [Allomyces macrogynus ATCC 38327]
MARNLSQPRHRAPGPREPSPAMVQMTTTPLTQPWRPPDPRHLCASSATIAEHYRLRMRSDLTRAAPANIEPDWLVDAFFVEPFFFIQNHDVEFAVVSPEHARPFAAQPAPPVLDLLDDDEIDNGDNERGCATNGHPLDPNQTNLPNDVLIPHQPPTILVPLAAFDALIRPRFERFLRRQLAHRIYVPSFPIERGYEPPRARTVSMSFSSLDSVRHVLSPDWRPSEHVAAPLPLAPRPPEPERQPALHDRFDTLLPQDAPVTIPPRVLSWTDVRDLAREGPVTLVSVVLDVDTTVPSHARLRELAWAMARAHGERMPVPPPFGATYPPGSAVLVLRVRPADGPAAELVARRGVTDAVYRARRVPPHFEHGPVIGGTPVELMRTFAYEVGALEVAPWAGTVVLVGLEMERAWVMLLQLGLQPPARAVLLGDVHTWAADAVPTLPRRQHNLVELAAALDLFTGVQQQDRRRKPSPAEDAVLAVQLARRLLERHAGVRRPQENVQAGRPQEQMHAEHVQEPDRVEPLVGPVHAVLPLASRPEIQRPLAEPPRAMLPLPAPNRHAVPPRPAAHEHQRQDANRYATMPMQPMDVPARRAEPRGDRAPDRHFLPMASRHEKPDRRSPRSGRNSRGPRRDEEEGWKRGDRRRDARRPYHDEHRSDYDQRQRSRSPDADRRSKGRLWMPADRDRPYGRGAPVAPPSLAPPVRNGHATWRPAAVDYGALDVDDDDAWDD